MEAEKRLLRLMNENGIVSMTHSYSGSGDGGGTDGITCYDKSGDRITDFDGNNDILLSAVEDIVFSRTSANFNNEGSAGEMTFTVDEEGLHMKGYHREFYESHTDTDHDDYIYSLSDPEDET